MFFLVSTDAMTVLLITRQRKSQSPPLPSPIVNVVRPRKDESKDIGPRLHEDGRRSFWEAQEIALGQSRYTAHVGPVTYQDKQEKTPDYYSIDVEKPEGDGASYVYFQRDIRLEALPRNFVDKPIADVVSYDPTTRTARFMLGDQKFEYRLPTEEKAKGQGKE
jgi:hypothetical protein